MKPEYKVRCAVVCLAIIMILMLLASFCAGMDLKESKPEKIATVTQEIEVESSEVVESVETIPEPTKKAHQDDNEYLEEESESEAERVKIDFVTSDEYEEPEETMQETEQENMQEADHECCDFYEEEYTEELGWACYKHVCVDCGETEYFEWADESDFEDETEESEHTDDDCSEFTDVDEDGYFYCLECGQAFCFDDED